MTLTVPEEIEIAVEEQARRFGIDKDGLVLKALQDYFLPIPSALQDEFNAWELASDQDALMIDTLLDETPDAAR